MPNENRPRRSERLSARNTAASGADLDPGSISEHSDSSESESESNRTIMETQEPQNAQTVSVAAETMAEIINQMTELRSKLETVTSQLEEANSTAAFERNERIRLQELLDRGQATPASTAVTTASVTSAGVSAAAASFDVSASLHAATTASAPPASMFTSVAAAHNTPYPWPNSVVSLPTQPHQIGSMTTMPCSSSFMQGVPTFLPPLGTFPTFSQQYTLPPSLTTPTSCPPFLSQPQTIQSSIGNFRKLQDLPEFTGRPEDWPMFSTAFKESSAMHNYSKMENMFRLQKSIKGDAREVVESLLIHPESVDQVMATLEFRFGRPECLLRSQLAKVRELPQIPEGKLEMLIPFSTRVLNLSTFLEASGMQQHLANPTLIDELVSKLPMSKRLEWAQRSLFIKPYPTAKHFAEWVTEIARLVCLVTTTSLISQPLEMKSKPKNVLHTKGEPPSTSKRCRHCNGPKHPLTECEAYTKLDIPDKWDFVKKIRVCFCCLKFGHNLRSCKYRKLCGIDGCSRAHHSSLHETKQSEMSTVSDDDGEDGMKKSVLSCSVNPNTEVLFRVLPVRLFGNKATVRTYALLDEGSSVTIMSTDLARQLHLNGQAKDLSLQWFGRETVTQKSFVVDVNISADSETAERYAMNGVQTVDELNLPIQSVTSAELQRSYSHLSRIPHIRYENAKPQILIGLDNAHLGAPIRTFESEGEGPIIAKTKLGWLVYGRSSREFVMESKENFVLHSKQSTEEEDERLSHIVDNYFNVENFGVEKPTQRLISAVDKRARQILSNTTTRVNGRYQTGLLWKEDVFAIPASYDMAKRRLWSLETKMLKDPEFATTYKGIIASYIEKGYARKLTTDEAKMNPSRSWYLPHFGVKNPNKPAIVRLVFDAAAKVGDVSLNSLLLKGPDDHKPLMTILFNFRLRPVAVSGDIKEMFLQIRIQPEDQHAQRFLWREEKDKPIDIYVMQSMTFGASCSPCSANFVKNLNALRFSEVHPRAVKAIIERHYVDDYVDCFDSVDEAVEVTNNVIAIHTDGGFELRGFTSNSKEVLRRISNSKEACHQNQTVDMNIEAPTDKILGMCWEPMEDVFSFKCNFPRVSRDVMVSDRCPTKREFLSIAMSVFDPYGMIANFIIHIKLLLQSVWRRGIEWDAEIPQDVFEQWKLWRAELLTLTQLKVSRCYHPHLSVADNITLHTFVDASEEAFSAVTFLRTEVNGSVRVSFICGKTKCAPKKLLSIPRLELLAAVLGVRLCNSVVESHDLLFKCLIFWTDSKTNIRWLRSDPRRYKQFVGFRIAEILDSSRVNQWRWVPSKLNPADEATPARHPPKFELDSKWIYGPAFLQLPEEDWPSQPDDIGRQEYEEEVRPKFLLHAAAVSMPFLDFSGFSRFSKLLRTTAWVLRFIGACRCSRTDDGELSAMELEVAKQVLCRQAQNDVFGPEIARLKQNLPVEKDSRIYKLVPYIDEAGLLRVYGRIDAATTIPFEARRPIILPKDHQLTKLLVAHYHRLLRHQNHDTIANEIRLRFWVPSLRSAIRRAKNDCQFCRIQAAQPSPPLMGQLPEDRLTPFIRPFTYTGLDYFGPVFVTVGRHKEKRWVALFTCMTVRAVHLEIAADLSTDACILCIRNFVNRRGVPARIRSDNGTNFIGAKKELMTIGTFDNDAIKAELASKGIQWIFNCPSNPHAGGCWERLVQSVKRVLSHSLNEPAPKQETLYSALIEAENIVNSRPLTHLPVSTEDKEPLTPNHFLLGAPNSTQTPGQVDARALCLRKQWRISQQIKDRFWRRWIQEYLPVLTRRCKWFDRVSPLAVGDLVLICDVDAPRSQWVRGRIVRVFSGQDKQIRSAEVKTTTGFLRRPAVKLAKLDVSEALGNPERLTGGGVS